MRRERFLALVNALGLWRPPNVIIDAPDYTHLHSGIRCLHLLCDRMSRLGIRAAVTCDIVDPRVATPRLRRKWLLSTPSLLNRSLVIYPEVTAGNPLNAKHVVRYLLNKPGFFTGVGMESFGPNDYFLHFADEFLPPGLRSRLLRLPLVDTSVFTPPPLGRERKGYLVYSDRYRPDISSFPDWIDERTTISRATPRDPPTLAELYRSSRALIVGERTAAIPEALHCHCPIIVLPNPEFNYEPFLSYFGGLGIVLGFDPAGYIQATQSVQAFAAHYVNRTANVDRQILEFVADAAHHFSLPHLQKDAQRCLADRSTTP